MKQVKLLFFLKIKTKKFFFTDKHFLHKVENWKPTTSLDDALWVMMTDQGNRYYDEFRLKFVESIISDGLIRQEKKYYLNAKLKERFRDIQSHFFISDVVRTLGMQPTHLTSYLVRYINDSFPYIQCIVDTRTSLITDISRIEN